jgi:predicted N-acetyltransferase YhbS
VEVGSERFDVVGLGGVIVNASFRGRGLARQVVQAAVEVGQTMGPEFMLLFCHPDRMGLYERLGFDEVKRTVLVKQPGGYEPMAQRTMWRALAPGATWPAGPPVIHTLPF